MILLSGSPAYEQFKILMDDFDGLLPTFCILGRALLSKCGPGISSTCEADTDESARVDLDELKSSPSPCLNISQNKVAAFCASPAQSAISHQAGVFATPVVNVWGNAQRD